MRRTDLERAMSERELIENKSIDANHSTLEKEDM
jgi:hypothetical protein